MQCACGQAAGKDGRCGGCRLAGFAAGRRKYEWTAALLMKLREVYSSDGMSLKRLEAETGIPRRELAQRARREGFTHVKAPRWTAEEDEYLRESIGRISVRQAAKRLGRTPMAVEHRAYRLEMSIRIDKEGYNVQDLRTVFGVGHDRVARWMERGLLGPVHRNGSCRVAERNVMKFLRQHTHEYDLRRVDQVWYKAMVFGDRVNGA